MKNLRFIFGVLFMSTLSVTAFSQTRTGNDAAGSGKPAREQASGKEHDHNHGGNKGHKEGKGHAYGKNKGDMSGREFGQQRSQDARSKDRKEKKPAQQQPAGNTPSGGSGVGGRNSK